MSKKKKVLFLVNHDIVIYNFRKELVERLLEEGYEVIISSPYGEKIEDLVELGCRYVEVKIDRHGTNIIKEFNLLKKYNKIIKEIKPDVILGFTIKPNIYGAYIARKYKIPFIANITGLGTAVEQKGILQKVTILLYKFSFKKIQKVFFQNEENQHFFIDNKISIDKHHLLPGSGVNLQHFKPLMYPKVEKNEFAFISRIMKQKGIEQFLDAATIISKKYPETRFHVCGFCEEDYEEILNDYQDRNIIVYHGMIKDIRKILNHVHCVVHPTYYPEGLSNVLLESSACARPIITTNRSGTREVVDNNKNGYLIEMKNSNDLVMKLEKFINLNYSEKKNMGLHGRKKVEKEFDRQLVVDAYMKEISR